MTRKGIREEEEEEEQEEEEEGAQSTSKISYVKHQVIVFYQCWAHY